MRKPEQIPTFEEQAQACRSFVQAADERNDLLRVYPDMDDLAVFIDSDPANRELYEGLERRTQEMHKAFNELVPNKIALVNYLRDRNEDQLAETVVRVFLFS